MKTYKESYWIDLCSVGFATSMTLSIIFATLTISTMLGAIKVSEDKYSETIIITAISSILFGLITYFSGKTKDIRLRIPNSKEKIKILFIKKMNEDKYFYIYSIWDKIIYVDERDFNFPPEVGKEYLVGDCGKLKLIIKD